ncbi:hypothetical protein RJT34_14247 [Clitoria ternatea]|uniref:Uncharacterized protein n=1 Tax=Clitoria ternatea TaxID=43366 RepID=A0AAN9JS87_CLITE
MPTPKHCIPIFVLMYPCPGCDSRNENKNSIKMKRKAEETELGGRDLKLNYYGTITPSTPIPLLLFPFSCVFMLLLHVLPHT